MVCHGDIDVCVARFFVVVFFCAQRIACLRLQKFEVCADLSFSCTFVLGDIVVCLCWVIIESPYFD